MRDRTIHNCKENIYCLSLPLLVIFPIWCFLYDYIANVSSKLLIYISHDILSASTTDDVWLLIQLEQCSMGSTAEDTRTKIAKYLK